MSATFGNKIKITLYGTSHGPSIGAEITGVPAGFKVDEEKLAAFMGRRRAKGNLATPRIEADKVIFTQGLSQGVTNGDALCLMINNTNTRSGDYADVAKIPRPNHADFAAFMKYGDDYDFRGGGQFSGRLTAAWCAAGFICLELLSLKGITVVSHVSRIGEVTDEPIDNLAPDTQLNQKLKSSAFPVINEEARERMSEAILAKKAMGDSLGGEIECAIYNLPAGLGSDFFGGLEALVAQTVFSIPAVKGLEFGKGFEFAGMCASVANDPFGIDENGEVVTLSNNCGGILGGISSGMPLTFKAAFKPTPSISIPQKSVDLKTMTETELTIHGRHDPCIVPRAAAVVEAAAAMAIINADGFEI